MGHLEFEGFDTKTTKALEKKVADAVAPMTKDEAIKALASVFIDEESGLKETANGLQFYADSSDGCEYWCQAYTGGTDQVKFWEVARGDQTAPNGVPILDSYLTLDALLVSLRHRMVEG